MELSMSGRIGAAQGQLRKCLLCGNVCGADRGAGEVTICEAEPQAQVSRVVVHHGEEPPLSGSRGCGNIFFHHCSLSCVFCQNWQISSFQTVIPQTVTPMELAMEMLKLQEAGVHTLGLVGATSHLPTVVPALVIARTQGLAIPVVHNTGGFDSAQALRMLDGLVDIYLPDMKYASNATARTYSGVDNYVEVNRAAVKEMYRQVGDLVVDRDGIARRGLLIRHLILPGGLSDTVEVLEWIARNLSTSVHLSLMSQYKPAFQAAEGLYPELNRPLTEQEYDFYLAVAEGLGFQHIFAQDLDSAETYNPDFSSSTPFIL